VIDYRGSVTPVVDLRAAISGVRSERFMSTRIMIVNYPAASGIKPLGLVAERVLDTARLEKAAADGCGVKSGTAPWLGAVMKLGGDIILCMDVRKLLPGRMDEWLFKG
jgi:chemotaxis-related protein WspB